MSTIHSHQNGPQGPKASSLPDSAALASPRSGQAARRGGGKESLNPRRTGRRGGSWIVDIILIVLLAGVITGAWFGYRALKAYFSPAWQERDVMFIVELPGVDPALLTYNDDGQLSLVGKDIWSSDRTDADRLGRVASAETLPDERYLNSETGREGETDDVPVTLYVTVSAKANYRPAEGYWMGGTRLLAGSRGTFRLEGLVASGEILTLDEAADFRPLVRPETDTDGISSDEEPENAAAEESDENGGTAADGE